MRKHVHFGDENDEGKAGSLGEKCIFRMNKSSSRRFESNMAKRCVKCTIILGNEGKKIDKQVLLVGRFGGQKSRVSFKRPCCKVTEEV